MKIVVVGGTGLIGSKIVALFRARGDDVTAASPGNGINSVSGEGLEEALTGASVVIDVTNAPSSAGSAAKVFFETSSRNLLAVERLAGVRHHVALSIVGADRVVGQGYYRAKIAQEQLIKASGVPYTLVRAAQFLEFLAGIADAHVENGVVRLPLGLLQPVAADDVAGFLAEVALADPLNATVEIAGPERAPLDEIVGRYLKATGDPRGIVGDPEARYFGGRLAEGSLVPMGSARRGRIHLESWLRLGQN